jgi:hypothetical protein
MPFKENSFDGNHNQREQEHENGNAVDTVHVFHPLAVRCVRVTLFDVEIFCYLIPDAH